MSRINAESRKPINELSNSANAQTRSTSCHVKPNEHFRFEPQYQFNRITLPTEAFSMSLFGSRVSYFFSTTLFAKIFTQWNSNSDELFAQL